MGINLYRLLRHETLSKHVRGQLSRKKKRLIIKLNMVNELLARPVLLQDKKKEGDRTSLREKE